jgi:phospholipid transport system transporter-binding protein
MKIDSNSLTNDNAARFVALGCAAIAGGDAVFDLSAVKEVDSAAVATLLAWRREADRRGLKLDIREAPAALCSLVSLYGVESLLDVPAVPAAPLQPLRRH